MQAADSDKPTQTNGASVARMTAISLVVRWLRQRCCRPTAPYTVLLFHSEGEPHDRGLPLTAPADELATVVLAHTSRVVVETPRSIRARRPDVVREHGEELRLAKNPGSHAINFNAYKAWMALEAFARGEDIVIYRDSNSFKYPHLLDGWGRMEAIARRLLSACPFWMFAERPGCTVEHHVKPRFLDEYIEDEGARRAVSARPLLNASFFICRRCRLAQQILEEVLWLHLHRCDLLAGPGVALGLQEEVPARIAALVWPFGNKFLWSCGDQDAFNLVLRKHQLQGDLPQGWPGEGFFYKRVPTVAEVERCLATLG